MFISHHQQCRDTFWVETLHMVMLIYTPKRIHFNRQDTYDMRIQLSILDWVGSVYFSFIKLNM